ncbi:ATP-binding cassette domain-containing protein [Francisellaceae bacterium]|nr:ATP-binding cassette domain-containing protein [Francisellaceae bacterium]
MIEIKDLSVGEILKNVNAAIAPGKLIAIIGPNGAGKSTLVKAISGIIDDYRGAIYLNSQNMLEYPVKARANLLAYMPQHIELAFDYSVAEIIEMGVYALPMNQAEKQNIIQAAIKEADIAPLIKRIYPTLSGGEKQRVHLARVMAQLGMFASTDPQYLMLDEHTAHLDLRYQHESFQMIKGFVKAHHLAAVAVVHDINLARAYADEVWVVHEGRLYAAGQTEEVMTEEMISEVFKMKVKYLEAYRHFIVL